MARYRFEIQALQTLEIEARNAREAREKIFDGSERTILANGCDNFSIDPYVSDGVKISD